MENWPGRFSVFLLLASRLYVSQQGETKWPCGAVFPISALPIETHVQFSVVREQLWHPPSVLLLLSRLTLIILMKASHVSLCRGESWRREEGRERAGISSGGVSLEECSWWSAGESDECVPELRVPRGAGWIRPAVALGSLCLSLSYS